jgi:signal transduction histidine kinase
MFAMLDRLDGLLSTPGFRSVEDILDAVEAMKREADLDYLRQRMPRAFDRTRDGVQRLAGIVGAMREFSHPDQREPVAADLNAAVENALILARPQYKHEADSQFDPGSLPSVLCHVGDIAQVLLNLIVNAAHAISDRRAGQGPRGHIAIATSVTPDGQQARIRIQDDGAGMTPEVASRVFEPFFTTKGVGRGTGQGLAIARAIIVERHGGRLTFESAVGAGTTFVIELPVAGKPAGNAPVSDSDEGQTTIASSPAPSV